MGLFLTASDIEEFDAQNLRVSCDCGNCHSSAIITLKSVSFTMPSWLLNIQNMLLHSWLCSSSTEIGHGKLAVSTCPGPLRGSLAGGGEFYAEESLHVWPDLVGFCPRECVEHTFTPGGHKENPEISLSTVTICY